VNSSCTGDGIPREFLDFEDTRSKTELHSISLSDIVNVTDTAEAKLKSSNLPNGAGTAFNDEQNHEWRTIDRCFFLRFVTISELICVTCSARVKAVSLLDFIGPSGPVLPKTPTESDGQLHN
jgi:hypothetical protein